MTPPTDRRLALHGECADRPLVAPLRYGVRCWAVFLTATLLGLASTALAWQYTVSVDRTDADLAKLLLLNCSYWYVWAFFTPSIVWLSQHYRFEWQGIVRALAVHLPSVVVFSLAHIAAMGGLQWWLAAATNRPFWWWDEVRRSAILYFDWEMMTYWTIVGLSHAVLYYRESRDRAVRASQLESRLVQAQLNALQQQLHPHFLFNALQAVSTLMHRDVDAADRTLVRLSDLLRITLENAGRQQITLEAELDFISKYLLIEQTRFGDRLFVRFDVEPDAMDTLVPSLILQPLVENAIKHGVARKDGLGHIDITARRDGDKLRMEVRDDGAGLSENALTALQKGIGVSTTRARLEHLFGADYRFEFHRLPAGLAVVVAVPWRTAAGSADRDEDERADALRKHPPGHLRPLGKVAAMARQHT